MFSSLILCLVLAQVPEGPSEAAQATEAAQARPSKGRNPESQRLLERRKERRARAVATWRRDREGELRAAERLAPFIIAQQQAEAARWHFWSQQAHRNRMLYPYGYPWYPYPWPRRSGPIPLGPFPEPGPRSGPIPLGPFPEPMPQPSPLPVSPPSP